MRPCFSQESCLTTFSLVHAQKSKFLDDKPSLHFRLFVFSFYFFRFSFFSSSFVFAAVFGLLPGLFPVEEFPRKRKRGKNWVERGNIPLSFSLKF